ncbi:MipA/OmpV family protein [Massilia sp. LXY-6]|uniref:MipA/OmpV family protein n=1 Tax=Massilia sp. LXY-6 TaxID=3379823 RepID=UPI003EDFD120
MNKLLPPVLSAGVLAALLAGGIARAQTPAVNPMPDGSRDMYVGLGVQSAPRYEGAGSRKLSALPVLQVEWSKGIFISGMSAGMHLSKSPTVEYGPLLALKPGRDESGTGIVIDGVNGVAGLAPKLGGQMLLMSGRLDGMDEIGARLQAGGFYNVYLSPQWRLTSSLLAGAGRDHDGARLELGVQRLALAAGERHRVSLTAGLGVVNRQYNESYFGVSAAESLRSRFRAYEPGGGLQDVQVGARWNWVLGPSWMLTSSLQAKRLLGDASHSPLAERSTNLTVSTAFAYRF